MSGIIGTILVVATLQICDRYHVHDLGLGLLVSLAPVGVFDLAKWWFRRSGRTMTPYRTIDHVEAQRLLEAGTAIVIDVRTPARYAQLGHIPGAWLLPVDLMASAPAILPDDRAECWSIASTACAAAPRRSCSRRRASIAC